MEVKYLKHLTTEIYYELRYIKLQMFIVNGYTPTTLKKFSNLFFLIRF